MGWFEFRKLWMAWDFTSCTEFLQRTLKQPESAGSASSFTNNRSEEKSISEHTQNIKRRGKWATTAEYCVRFHSCYPGNCIAGTSLPLNLHVLWFSQYSHLLMDSLNGHGCEKGKHQHMQCRDTSLSGWQTPRITSIAVFLFMADKCRTWCFLRL